MKKKESVYLKNIERDLKELIRAITDQMNFELDILKTAKPILEHYKKHHKFQVDSAFTSAIGRLTNRMTFVKINPTYTELLTAGNIDIISNIKIKAELINYYQQLERLELIINKNNNLFTDAVFVPAVLKLSEIQLSHIYNTLSEDILSIKTKDSSTNFIDLNENNLKAITASQLEIPGNQLAMINLINYRYQLSIIHYDFLNGQKEKTQILLEKINAND